MKPTPEHMQGFWQGIAYAQSLLERPDCKTARRIINKERMTLRLYEESHEQCN